MPLLEPGRAAKTLLGAVERDGLSVLLDQDAKVMDLLYRLNPLGATRLIQRRMRHLLG